MTYNLILYQYQQPNSYLAVMWEQGLLLTQYNTRVLYLIVDSHDHREHGMQQSKQRKNKRSSTANIIMPYKHDASRFINSFKNS